MEVEEDRAREVEENHRAAVSPPRISPLELAHLHLLPDSDVEYDGDDED